MTGKPRFLNEIALTEYSPEKAGVGGSTPSRGTNCFAATEPTQQIPFPLSKIEAFSGRSHWRQVDSLNVLEKLHLGSHNVTRQQFPQVPQP
jgi:hypothetical protein